MLENHNCGNCRFSSLEGSRRLCRRYPEAYPVYQYHWCGEYQPSLDDVYEDTPKPSPSTPVKKPKK